MRKDAATPRTRIATTANALEGHARSIRSEQDPEKLREIATYVRNCAQWIEWAADEMTPKFHIRPSEGK